jgi:hypothetical protein
MNKIDLRVAMIVDVSETKFLFVEAFAKGARGIGVIENVAAGLELHFELRDRERPRAEGLHEAAFEIKEACKTAGVFLDGKFSAKVTRVAWESIRKCAGTFGGGSALSGA